MCHPVEQWGRKHIYSRDFLFGQFLRVYVDDREERDMDIYIVIHGAGVNGVYQD